MTIEVICGPMFSGKTEELMRRAHRHIIAGRGVHAIKHIKDCDRYEVNHIASHNGKVLPCVVSDDLLRVEDTDRPVIVVDEIQFFPDNTWAQLSAWSQEGKRVIVSGLDMNYMGVPFAPTIWCLGVASSVTKLRAVCNVCGDDAFFSHLLGEVEEVGGKDKYQARCHEHFWSEK